ncbi:hypothetical protein AGABI2DRAFT_200889 [Agaricus bisporus var. bisporus H97]|uniref:hypothetical protein n=1 Tax=Agaricus bisporus var. bisporus (strain H97 / ATCC MYA-4626 / FGSC 10389) TaxID=936046 RepID=UPI00029F52AD|nr:hypothetical protein AGABI2DRAFT_200889 [Agaricus bisporus var. bisporus H97]EKV48905.1 hypothetical protein AGABI2DRAFT_200889 [Agaricus bisporus var. bisporus H97]
MLFLELLALGMPVVSFAYPHNPMKSPSLRRDVQADNTVKVVGPEDYCLVMPRDPHTNIGDSEYPGGTQVFCSSIARSADEQGLLPDNFWENVELHADQGVNGGKYVQLTGCIRPSLIDRLNPLDEGGQYDSSGGREGRGNPRDSVCVGYNHYVELVEPALNRSCIRCCEDFDDCVVSKDTKGCPAVIPGNYFNCD